MATNAKDCPDCGGEMVEGFIFDTGKGPHIPRWLEGRPEQSFWTGVNTEGKDCRSVETYRCTGCGLLRSYAVTEVDPPGFWNS